MAGIAGRPLGRPAPASPLGEPDPVVVQAPRSAKVGYPIPDREEDATVRFDRSDSELDDEPDDLPLTPRQRRAV